MFQPLQLISEYGVEVKVLTLVNEERIAWVQAQEKGFLITLNESAIEKHYTKSWVQDHISLQYYTLGFLMHEISHIKYKSFEGIKPFDDSLYHLIDNILDDSRIEHALWYEYPAHAQPLRWTLASILPTLDIPTAKDNEAKEKVKVLLETLFRVSRFGSIRENDDMEFVSFCLPLLLSATVNDRQNLLDACGLIYLWILEACDGDTDLQKQLQRADTGTQAIKEEEIKKLLEEGEEVADSGVQELLRQVHMQKDATYTDHEIHIDDQTNAFCRQIIARRAEEIQEMHTTFRLTRQGWDEALTTDDTGSIHNIIGAYTNSFLLDEDADFTEPRCIIPALTLWLVRDVSDSTNDVKEQYAEVCVMLHAALTDIPKVRSAQIDFADSAKIVKIPDEALSESKLYPYIDGGTYLSSAVELLEHAADFGTDQKILCILTDGWFHDQATVKEKLDRLVEEKSIDETFIIYVDESQHDLSGENEILGYPAYYCGPNSIPEVIYAIVLRLRGRY